MSEGPTVSRSAPPKPFPKLRATEDEIRAKLSALSTFEDVASLLEVTPELLRRLLYGLKLREKYDFFDIPKKRGGARRIHKPPKNLAILQKKLNHALGLAWSPRSCVHGFCFDRSILTNAGSHSPRRWILNIDLSDFFESVNLGRIIGVLLEAPFRFGRQAATTIAQIATRADGRLPQGSPVSPLFSNIVAYGLDLQLIQLAKSTHCKYTRYADDITFSTTKPVFPSSLAQLNGDKTELSSQLVAAVQGSGFTPNLEKCRLQNRFRRQEVTGLTVNEFPNISRSFVREVRTTLHLLKKIGVEPTQLWLQTHLKREVNVLRHLQGKLAHLIMVRGRHDPVVRRLARQFAAIAPEFEVRFPTLSELQPQPLRGHRQSHLNWTSVFNRMKDAVQFLEIAIETGDKASGTAFSVQPNKFVTAGHNLEHQNVLIFLNDSEIGLQTEIAASRSADHGVDLGILRLINPSTVSESPRCMTQNRLPEIGEPVAAIGFPSQPLRSPTKAMAIGVVESLPTSYFGTRFIQVSFQSGGGLSGGPLLDRAGYVLGVMVENTGSPVRDGQIAARTYAQAIPIEYLDMLGTDAAGGMLSRYSA